MQRNARHVGNSCLVGAREGLSRLGGSCAGELEPEPNRPRRLGFPCVLEVLLHKGPLPVNTIGPKVWLTPGSISVAVDRLEKKALVKRKNTDDRRVRLVELTAKGRALITKTFREHAAAMEEAAAVLSKEERLLLLRLLKKLGKGQEL